MTSFCETGGSNGIGEMGYVIIVVAVVVLQLVPDIRDVTLFPTPFSSLLNAVYADPR